MKQIIKSGMRPGIQYVLTALIIFLLATPGTSAGNPTIKMLDTASIEGRWDITVDNSGKKFPSWLEVQHSGLRTLVGRFVGGGGSARPISQVNFSNGKMNFSIPPQWEKEDKDLYVEGSLQGARLMGFMIAPDGKRYTWIGVRAPILRREKEPVWDKPIVLFNGKDLKGWHALGAVNQWKAESGILKSPKSGARSATERRVTDFKLHI